jgi:hypothetical protein
VTFCFNSLGSVCVFAVVVTAMSAITGVSLPPPQVWQLLGIIGGVLARGGSER